MILQTEGNEADEVCGARIDFFLKVTCKTSNIVEFDQSCMYFSGLFNTCVAFVNRVVYSYGFQIFFGKAFKCIHVARSKFQIIGLCQAT